MGRLTIPNIFKRFRVEGTKLVELEKIVPEANKEQEDGASSQGRLKSVILTNPG